MEQKEIHAIHLKECTLEKTETSNTKFLKRAPTTGPSLPKNTAMLYLGQGAETGIQGLLVFMDTFPCVPREGLVLGAFDPHMGVACFNVISTHDYEISFMNADP